MPPRSSHLKPTAEAAGSRVQVLLLAVQSCLRLSIDSGSRDVTVAGDQSRCAVEVSDDGRGIASAVLLGSNKAATELHTAVAALSRLCWVTVTSKPQQSFETCCWSCNKGQVVKQGLAAEQQAKSGTVILLRFQADWRRVQTLVAEAAIVTPGIRWHVLDQLQGHTSTLPDKMESLLSLAWGASPGLWTSFTAQAGPCSASLHLAVCDPKAAARTVVLRPHLAVNGQHVDHQPFADILAALQCSLLTFRKQREFVPAAADYLVHLQCPASSVVFGLQGSILQGSFRQPSPMAGLLQAAATKLLHAAGVSAGLRVKPDSLQLPTGSQRSQRLTPSRPGAKRLAGLGLASGRVAVGCSVDHPYDPADKLKGPTHPHLLDEDTSARKRARRVRWPDDLLPAGCEVTDEPALRQSSMVRQPIRKPFASIQPAGSPASSTLPVSHMPRLDEAQTSSHQVPSTLLSPHTVPAGSPQAGAPMPSSGSISSSVHTPECSSTPSPGLPRLEVHSAPPFARVLRYKRRACRRLQLFSREEAAGVSEASAASVRGLVDARSVQPIAPPEPEAGAASLVAPSKPSDSQSEQQKTGAEAAPPPWLNPVWVAAGPAIPTAEQAQLHSKAPEAVQRKHLQRAKIVGQLDCKFIIAQADGLLFIVDQHAADERVRLERLQHQATSPVLDPGMFTSSILSPTISVHLGGQQLHWLSQHAQALLRWGWRWSVSSAAGSMVEVQQAPFILGKHVQAAELQAWTEEIGTSSGCLATPAAVTTLLASAACRYAIMFGDELSHEEAGRLLQDLSQTRLCFVCAHGRPTTSPLLNIKQLTCHLSS